MLSGPVYITPTELLTRAPLGQIPRAEIPGPQFKGKLGAVTNSGGFTSTGTIRVTGFPIDAYPAIIKVVVGGALGTAQFAVSLDGGVTYDDPVLTVLDDTFNSRMIYEIGITGVVLLLANDSGNTPGSFVVDDEWLFTTTASAKLIQMCGVLSDYLRKWQQNTAQKTMDIDEADRNMICEYGRWLLVAGRGDVPKDWKELADNARVHFKLESLGDINTNVVPSQDAYVFPDSERPRGAFRFNIPGTCIPIWSH